jgi:hypothetical protein
MGLTGRGTEEEKGREKVFYCCCRWERDKIETPGEKRIRGEG